jgi:two-component system heavy metal sensor histidine kinase CusS
MFCKRADFATAGVETTGRNSRFWSIAAKLTLLYTLSAGGMLVLAAGFLYWALARNLLQEDQQFLADKIYVLRGILRERADDPTDLVEEIQWEGAARRFAKYYARIIDARGHTLIETPGMRDVLLAAVFPVAIGVHDTPEKAVKWRSPHGPSYLLMAAWAQTQHANAPPQLVQVALDISPNEALLADYRHTLAVVLLVGIICSAAIGVMMTRKGLRPLNAITTAAQRITVTHLHQRIAPARWPQELTALATAFDEMLDRLEDAFTRLSQFSADLAHELRTPINNLIGATDVALSRCRTSEEYRQVLESNREEYTRLAYMIESLLFLAQAESPQTRIDCSEFDARKALEAMQEFYEAMAEESGVEVICQGQAVVYAAPMLFRRAVSNLLSNALHYTPRGGKITLAVSQEEDEAVIVSIGDTGCGIALEHLPKLFDRFYRVDPARSPHPQGTGLGLAIVKSIMDLHSGTVTIHSAPSQGTRVTLGFPPPPAALR